MSKLRAFWGDQTDPKSAGGGPNSISRTGHMSLRTILHISHQRQWWTFSKPLPSLAQRMRNLGLFWPIWAILWRIYALFGVLFTGPKIYKYQVCLGLILNTTCIDNWWLTTFCMVWLLSTWFMLAWDFFQIFLRISSKSGGFNQFGFLLSWLPFSPSPRNFTPAAVTILFKVLWRWRR